MKYSKKYLKSISEEKLISLIENDKIPLIKITEPLQSPKVCMAMVKKDYNNFLYIIMYKQTEQCSLYVIKKDPSMLRFVYKKTIKICKVAIKKHPPVKSCIINDAVIVSRLVVDGDIKISDFYIPNDVKLGNHPYNYMYPAELSSVAIAVLEKQCMNYSMVVQLKNMKNYKNTASMILESIQET